MNASKPNIIMMISHDTGRYLGCYGRPAETPNIDTLAENGVRFDHYFCSSPQCSPSRGSILTGLYPVKHGMIGLAHLGFSIREGTPTLPGELRKAGYDTVLIGLSHETIGENGGSRFTSGKALGYDAVVETAGDRASDVGAHAASFLRERSKSKETAGDRKPFYLSLGFFETHRDFDEYTPVPREEAPPPEYLPDTEAVRDDFAALHGSVKSLDQGIGIVLNALRETGLHKDTIVIFTTDHGIAFPRAKGTLFDSGLETALIISFPDRFPSGKTNSTLLCNVDLMPTLLDMAGFSPPDGLDGRSFLHLLEGREEQVRDHFFCSLTWHDAYHPMRGIRTQRFKYVRNLIDGPAVYLPLDVHRSLSGRAVQEEYYRPNVPEELYDLERDPLETRNAADDPAFVHILARLRERVESHRQETNDPVLQGPVPGLPAPDWAAEVANGSAYSARKGAGGRS